MTMFQDFPGITCNHGQVEAWGVKGATDMAELRTGSMGGDIIHENHEKDNALHFNCSFQLLIAIISFWWNLKNSLKMELCIAPSFTVSSAGLPHHRSK